MATSKEPLGRLAVLQHVTRASSIEADCELASACGYRGLGVDHTTIAARGVKAVDAALRTSGLMASSLVGLGPGPTPPGGQAAVDHASPMLEAAAALAAPGVLVTIDPLSGRSFADADDEARRWLESVGPAAADLGVRIMVEPVHPLMRSVSYVHSLGHALHLVGAIPGVGVAIDLGHLWWDPQLPDQLRSAPEDVATVQITDVDVQALEDLRYQRAQLGDGDVPLLSLLSTLEAAGYRGWYENEILLRMPRAERSAFMSETVRRFSALCSSL